MPQEPPDSYPITGLCIVADPAKCPAGYNAILHSQDRKEDCDMWKDSFFKARVTRYLCFTRIFPLAGGRLNNVLTDVTINNLGDQPPTGFSVLEKTQDSGEKGSRKRQICVKMVARNMCADAITDLIFLSRQKRAPSGYCNVGEVNGLLLCYKIGVVPPETQNNVTQNNYTQQSSYHNVTHPYNQGWNTGQYSRPPPPYTPGYTRSAPPYAVPMIPPTLPAQQQQQPNDTRNTLSRQDSVLQPTNQSSSQLQNPMYGVPFQLSSRLRGVQGLKGSPVNEIHYRSAVDIENEYNYSFHLETQALTQYPTTP